MEFTSGTFSPVARVSFAAMTGVLALMGIDPAAHATVTLPAASGFVQCATKTGFITSATSCSSPNDSGSVSYSPFAGLQGNAFGEGLTDVAGVFGSLKYSFEVIGGKPGDVVPLDIEAALVAQPESIGYAFSEIGVQAETGADVTICSQGCATNTASFSGTLHVDAVSGVVYVNGLGLEIEAGGARGNASDFNGGIASADPFFFIDPSDPNASDYQILLSDGIGNGIPGGVPEPGLWAMLLAGLGTLGFAMRLRRKHSAVAFDW